MVFCLALHCSIACRCCGLKGVDSMASWSPIGCDRSCNHPSGRLKYRHSVTSSVDSLPLKAWPIAASRSGRAQPGNKWGHSTFPALGSGFSLWLEVPCEGLGCSVIPWPGLKGDIQPRPTGANDFPEGAQFIAVIVGVFIATDSRGRSSNSLCDLRLCEPCLLT